ncbi:hypothetical protein B0J12DRAFT_703801 [Macrophomina phaseolina]|uniref:Ser-Thr-rich glycosyl-phosphatidyl-inositol-anchored membrane family-domain-containing protein n=1 Tax=Macrophomina phaseolina TaxID=35725 RepID=A0ABQ8FXM9_9PEZI|nr:hypothetical protein B0J12DRAFT_703801 [Macrophomina phaseolina]
MFSLYIALLFFLATVTAQDNSVTYYHDGNFTYPNKFGMIYAAGSSITITWETIYNRSNLFYSQYDDDANSVSIAANTDETSWTWTVSTTKTNLSLPFHFRIVNAEGDSDAQYYGGFWSPGFYIHDSSKSAAAAASSTETTAKSSPTSTAAAISLPSSSVSKATSQPISTLPATSVQESAAATSTLASTPTTQPSPTASDSSDSTSISAGAIAGIVIGGIAAVGLVGGGLFLLGRRSHRQRDEPMSGPRGYDAPPPEYWTRGPWVRPPGSVHEPVELDVSAQKIELGSDRRIAELDVTGRRH